MHVVLMHFKQRIVCAGPHWWGNGATLQRLFGPQSRAAEPRLACFARGRACGFWATRFACVSNVRDPVGMNTNWIELEQRAGRTGGHLALGDDGSEYRDETQACRVLGDFGGFSFSIARKNERT